MAHWQEEKEIVDKNWDRDLDIKDAIIHSVALSKARKFYHKEPIISITNGGVLNKEATDHINQVLFKQNGLLEMLMEADIYATKNGACGFGIEIHKGKPIILLSQEKPNMSYFMKELIKASYQARLATGEIGLTIQTEATKEKYVRNMTTPKFTGNKIFTLKDWQKTTGFEVKDNIPHKLGIVPYAPYTNYGVSLDTDNFGKIADFKMFEQKFLPTMEAYKSFIWEMQMAISRMIINSENIDSADAEQKMAEMAGALTRKAVFINGEISSEDFEYQNGNFEAAKMAWELYKATKADLINDIGLNDQNSPSKKAQTNDLEVFAMGSNEKFTINQLLLTRQRNIERLVDIVMKVDIIECFNGSIYGKDPKVSVELIEPKDRDNRDYVEMVAIALDKALIPQVEAVQKVWGVSKETAETMVEQIRKEMKEKMAEQADLKAKSMPNSDKTKEKQPTQE